jgi:hypothetical protein
MYIVNIHSSHRAALRMELTFSGRTGELGARWRVRQEASASRNSAMPHIGK